MNWLEVSLTVNGELAEAVADVFARAAPNGVVAEQGVGFASEDDEGTAQGPITVRAFLPIDEELEARRRQLEESLYYLGRIQPLPEPTYTQVADQNWMEAWKRHYRPIPVGRRLLIVPAWSDHIQAGREQIKIDPGMAFGTGTHPSTQLCLRLLENAIERGIGADEIKTGPNAFIDVGCGSGILAIAAIKLGVGKALGVDIDAEALKNARENAIANGVGADLVLGRGSLDEIRRGDFGLRRAPLVAANILAPVIVQLLEHGLATILENGGCMVLGGILQDQSQRVVAAAESTALSLVETQQVGDWVALSMVKQPMPETADPHHHD